MKSAEQSMSHSNSPQWGTVVKGRAWPGSLVIILWSGPLQPGALLRVTGRPRLSGDRDLYPREVWQTPEKRQPGWGGGVAFSSGLSFYFVCRLMEHIVIQKVRGCPHGAWFC